MGFLRSSESLLEEWSNIPLILKAKSLNKEVEGTIMYGIRMPMEPGNKPLVECSHGSKEEMGIRGEKPAYWFVNPKQDIKIRLLIAHLDKKKGIIHGIYGKGFDVETFKYVITRYSPIKHSRVGLNFDD